jgi:hypothetical protein
MTGSVGCRLPSPFTSVKTWPLMEICWKLPKLIPGMVVPSAPGMSAGSAEVLTQPDCDTSRTRKVPAVRTEKL